MLCPFDLHLTPIARFLNLEIVNHPVYDGFELQYFDDAHVGTGMLAFLSRREDRRVDYYYEAGLTLDPDSYAIGGGTGTWTETAFRVARLEVTPNGVDAAASFTDVEGRLVEFAVDDRGGRRRRRGNLLAPVSSAIDHPNALLLVWLQGFDLVHAGATPPVIRIGGQDVATGRLPGTRLHRRLLVKYAAPLCSVELNRNRDGPLGSRGAGEVELAADGHGIRAITARRSGHEARLALTPAFPEPPTLAEREVRNGAWAVDVDGALITGGTWSATRRGPRVDLAFDVTNKWQPGPLPPLMWLVTRVVPVFRRWPTTYRWTATVSLDGDPTMVSRWERTSDDRGADYRRATGS